jgi:hypothetical protein
LHAILVHRTCAEWAARRLLVNEHSPLTERTGSLTHGERSIHLFGHKVSHARGERSSPSSDALGASLNRTRCLVAREGDENATRPSAVEGLGFVVRSVVGATPPPGVCVSRGERRRGPVHAASSNPICCRPRAWFRNQGRRRRGLRRSSCSAAGASGRKRPGTSPLTRRSLPFVTFAQTRVRLSLISLFERTPMTVHS